jgi:uncharacterized protein (DUF302 family)
MADEKGIAKTSSPYSVSETMNRIEAFLLERGLTVYKRINQQEELANAGIKIPAVEFIMFGNPAAGGAIIRQNILVALDLPLKLLVFEDGENKVWIAYNNARYIEDRYGLQPAENSPLDLSKLVASALSK